MTSSLQLSLLLSICLLQLTYVPFSQDVQFKKSYDKEPTIIITANHKSEGINLKPTYISVTAWIEVRLDFFPFIFIVREATANSRFADTPITYYGHPAIKDGS